MPDGGIGEDFLHVAGLLQVSVGNGTMRPFLLVGIENTERRRDMTGPTRVEEDRRIAPRVLLLVERFAGVADGALEPPVARDRCEPRRAAAAANPPGEPAFLEDLSHRAVQS